MTVTVDRLERALDRLAQIIVSLGDAGPRCLPIYERLESELEAIRQQDDKMASVHNRLKRLTGRRVMPPA